MKLVASRSRITMGSVPTSIPTSAVGAVCDQCRSLSLGGDRLDGGVRLAERPIDLITQRPSVNQEPIEHGAANGEAPNAGRRDNPDLLRVYDAARDDDGPGRRLHHTPNKGGDVALPTVSKEIEAVYAIPGRELPSTLRDSIERPLENARMADDRAGEREVADRAVAKKWEGRIGLSAAH